MARVKKGVPGSPDDNPDNELPVNAEPYGTDSTDVPEAGDSSYERVRSYSDFLDEEEPDAQEPLNRQLAQFAFVREEDDREVRLYFRDVPAHEIARAFRGSGAIFISMTGERALLPAAVAAGAQSTWTASTEVAPGSVPAVKARRKRSRKAQPGDESNPETATPRPNRHLGELTMRYFYSLGELVYTVNISVPTGLVESVASIFPVAAQSERELHTRLSVFFREVAA